MLKFVLDLAVVACCPPTGYQFGSAIQGSLAEHGFGVRGGEPHGLDLGVQVTNPAHGLGMVKPLGHDQVEV